ncbi:AraC family transcriptional regulator [Paenibacillus sp. CC-CFT747]|nr:AraC family transcriptional regulator [Paenibacillus sp. CC-CFT747]
MLGKLLKMQVIVAVSQPTLQAKDIPPLFAELRQVVRYRDLQREGQIIDMEDVVPEKKERSDYPFELEAAILEAVKLGIREEAATRTAEFVEALVHRSGKEYAVQQGIVQLFGGIQHVIMEAGVPSQGAYDGVDKLEQLLQLKEPAKMVEFLEKAILTPYMDELEKDQLRHRKQLVDRATDFLQSNFTNEVSLETCAEQLGVSKFTLSRAFKQTVGINFIDYVTRLRVEKSKEMLRGTDWKVSDIAERIGYQPSHFIRLFKKFEGMTPGQYRDNVPMLHSEEPGGE